jgi:Secretion system C-terminal sorting domain
MKSFFTLLFSISCCLLFAQSLSLNVTNLSVLSTEGVHAGDVIITNTSNSEVTLNTTLNRVCLNTGDATKIQICFGDLCFIATNDPTKTWTNVGVIPPGGTLENFKLVLDPPGTYASEWDVHFINKDDPTDFVSLNVKIGEGELPECASPTSTNDFAYTISKAFPNPATDVININYQIDVNDAQLNMYNAIGVLLKSITINPQTEIVSVDVADLASGVYFYNITDGKDQSKMMSFVK